MHSLKSFLKTTLVGGLMFLVPVVPVPAVLRHAMQRVKRPGIGSSGVLSQVTLGPPL